MLSRECSRPMQGWLRGCCTATIVIELCFVIGILASVHGVSPGGVLVVLVWMFASAPVIWLVTCAVSGIPAFITIRVSEKYRIRSALFFGCVGPSIGAFGSVLLFRLFAKLDFQSLANLAWLFALPGCLAGITYWYVAGRYAGQDDDAAFDFQ